MIFYNIMLYYTGPIFVMVLPAIMKLSRWDDILQLYI